MTEYCRDCSQSYPHPDYKWTLACQKLGLTTYIKDRGDGKSGLLIHNHIDPDLGRACEDFERREPNG